MILAALTVALAASGNAHQSIDDPPEAPPPSTWFGFTQHLDEYAPGADQIEVHPTAAVVGGVGLEHIERSGADTDQRQDRATTLALARGGLVVRFGPHFDLAGELEANAGPHGTSVWEGQAALQVRDTFARVRVNGLVLGDSDDSMDVEVGRITDVSSINYVSKHGSGDQLYTDEIARTPLLMAGFNRGNGAAVHYTLFDVVGAGLVFNAGNPTSNTGTLMLGGTFPPFARFYEVPFASVGKDASRFPVDSFHVMLLSPSLTLDTHWVKAHASLQMVHADTNMSSEKDEPLEGFNVRGGVSARLLENILWEGNALTVFANGSRIENDVVDPNNLARLQNDRYEAVVASTGFDLDLYGKSGVGAEVAVVREREPGRPPVLWQFANAGATWWLNDNVAVGVRGAYEQRCLDHDCNVDGLRSLFITARAVLDAPPPASSTSRKAAP